MSLIKCPECGKEKVSDTADSCPECGFGIKSYYNELKNEETVRLDIEKMKDEFYQTFEMPEKPIKKLYPYEIRQLVIGLVIPLLCILFVGIFFKVPIFLLLTVIICIALWQIYCTYSSFNSRYYSSLADYNKSLADEEQYKENKFIEYLEYNANQDNLHNNEETKIKCPRCGSTQITAGKRGYKLLSGLIGSSTVLNTCMKCGHQWRPGGYRYL